MLLQTNDTDLHKEVRKRFVEEQEMFQVRKIQAEGGGMANLSREDNLQIMIDVMSDPELHLQAAKGYKKTGTTISLDGKEDDLIVREARTFWDENDMRNKINAAVADVERRWNEGTLRWNFKDVQSLIHPYPKKNELDVILPGQEDEATPDPDKWLWMDPAGSDIEGGSGNGEDEKEDDEEGNPIENEQGFVSDDWEDTVETDDLFVGQEEQEEEEGEDEDEAPAAEPTVTELAVAVPAAAQTELNGHGEILAGIFEARRALSGLHNQVGANLRQVLDNTAHETKKRLLRSREESSQVQARLLRILEREEGSQAGGNGRDRDSAAGFFL